MEIVKDRTQYVYNPKTGRWGYQPMRPTYKVDCSNDHMMISLGLRQPKSVPVDTSIYKKFDPSVVKDRMTDEEVLSHMMMYAKKNQVKFNINVIIKS